jgi:hypothetical protein
VILNQAAHVSDQNGFSVEDLLKAIGEYNAPIVRSRTKVNGVIFTQARRRLGRQWMSRQKLFQYQRKTVALESCIGKPTTRWLGVYNYRRTLSQSSITKKYPITRMFHGRKIKPT